MSKYAISASAVKMNGNRVESLGTSSAVTEAINSTVVKEAAMEYALTILKPSDGFVGHAVSVTEIQEEVAPKKHWFKFG